MGKLRHRLLMKSSTGFEFHTFSPSFFLDEVREGFYVSGMMKRYWAAQLTVLAAIDRVCQNHGIRWFADNGTLLGAARHGGYIPWDDDLDIVMLRDDLELFLTYAKDELPDGYQILHPQVTTYEYLIAQVTNGFTIGLQGEALVRNQGCPFITGVDIFTLDGVFADPARDKTQAEQILAIDKAGACVKQGQTDTPEVRALLKDIERTHHTTLPRDKRLYHALLALEDRVFSVCPVADADAVAQMIFHPFDGSHTYPKAWYRDTVYLPFENTYLPVPACYEAVLRAEYGAYINVYRGGGSHDYPVYGNQEALLKQNGGLNASRYTFQPAHLQAAHAAPRAERIRQMTDVLKKVDAQATALAQAGDGENANRLLLSARGVLDALEVLTRDKKEIVFLAVRAAWWQGAMDALWRAAKADETCDVYVVPVPYSFLNVDGTMIETIDERALFPDEVALTPPDAYDFAARQPDIVVTPFPFDGSSPTMTIPPYFYTENLRKIADKVVFLPYLEPETPEENDLVSRAALAILAEQPAVVYADKTILPSKELAEIFIDELTKIAGTETRDVWEEKVVGLDAQTELPTSASDTPSTVQAAASDDEATQARAKKRLLFFVSIALFLERGDDAIKKLQSVVRIFSDHADELEICWLEQAAIEDLKMLRPELWEAYQDARQTFSDAHCGFFAPEEDLELAVADADAYYGCAGVAAHMCVLRGAPVMIMDCNV